MGSDSLLIRFRLNSDSTLNRDGFYMDDLKLYVSDNPPTAIENMLSNMIPHDFYMKQNYPNPFNPSTIIEFGLKSAAKVNLTIYNILGQKISELANNQFQAGRYRINWDGKNTHNQMVGSGLYFYHLEVVPAQGKKKEFRKKMILVR